MAIFNRLWDSTGKSYLFVPYPGFVDQSEVVAGSAKTSFVISGATITANHKIDAWVDGRLQVDGAHFNKNIGTNSIDFTEAVPVGKRADIRVYLR